MPARTHILKTWPSYFEAVADNKKTFEIRLNDRDFAVGDILCLEEYDPRPDGYSEKCYTGKRLERRVTYVMHGGNFGLDRSWCVLGLGEHSEKP